MLKKTLKTLIVLAVIGIVVYKAYEYLITDDKYEEFDDNVDGEYDLEAEAEESLADKIKTDDRKKDPKAERTGLLLLDPFSV